MNAPARVAPKSLHQLRLFCQLAVFWTGWEIGARQKIAIRDRWHEAREKKWLERAKAQQMKSDEMERLAPKTEHPSFSKDPPAAIKSHLQSLAKGNLDVFL